MKKLLFTLAILFPVLHSDGQSAKFSWGKTVGSGGNEQGNSVATDPMGNVYTVGKFTGTIDFDPGPGVFNITAFGLTDIFVMKQDPTGAFLWAKKFGGALDEEASSVTLDPMQNIYITGTFKGVADFNPGIGGGVINSIGDRDIFTVKLDRDGFFQWVRRLGGSTPDMAMSNTWDKLGYIYSTGTIWSLSSLAEIYITKMDQFGNTYWTRTFGTDGIDQGNSIAVDKFGNIYTIGTFEGSGDFDPLGGVFKLGTNGLKDIFISKFSSTGALVWVKQIGGPNNDIGKGIDVTDSGYVYITGNFSGKVDFDISTLDADTNYITSKGANDIFLAKLDLSGNFLWAKAVGEADADCAGMSCKADLWGNVVVTGVFSDTVNFDPRPTKSYVLNSAGNHDVFVMKFDLSSNFIWAKRFGGTLEDSSIGMNIDMAGNILTTGLFRDSVDFNPAKEVFKLGSVGNSDVFIHKLDYCVPVYTTINDTICDSFILDGVTYNKSGFYKQTITGLTGCEEFVTMNLDVRHLNDTVSVSGVVLTSHATGVKYQWIGCKLKNEIAGATGKSYIALGNADYAVTIFDGHCRDTSACHTISSFPTSVEDFALQNSVQIFPNPSNGEFVIAVKESMIGAKASIYNLLGQKVRDVELNESNTKQSLTPGFYVIEITKEQKRTIKKLLVE
ncbi:MAG: SBBP repeat-containing protein [Bacteroidota bacterium]